MLLATLMTPLPSSLFPPVYSPIKRIRLSNFIVVKVLFILAAKEPLLICSLFPLIPLLLLLISLILPLRTYQLSRLCRVYLLGIRISTSKYMLSI